MPKKIIVAPLDWGIGHASRCIPIIYHLIQLGKIPILAGQGLSLNLLRAHFPQLPWIHLPGVNITYPKKGPISHHMAKNGIRLFYSIYKEHKILKHIIAIYAIEGVISDSRYGLYSKQIPCVFISHQINIQTKLFSRTFTSIGKWFIRKYTYCFIPDQGESINLSGALSHGKRLPKNCIFIGPLSRFNHLPRVPINTTKAFEIIIILSGPEPQRSIFENTILTQIKAQSNYSILLIQGLPTAMDSGEIIWASTTFAYTTHLSSTQLSAYMATCQLVICRSGYSSIMDLVTLRQKAILIPTPGQEEQLYLAHYLEKTDLFYCVEQDLFSINQTIPLAHIHFSSFFQSKSKGRTISNLTHNGNTLVMSLQNVFYD